MSIDEHGDRVNQFACDKKNSDRDADELIGICRGIIADGTVVEEEARFLHSWLNDRKYYLNSWLGKILKERLDAYFEDDVWDKEEQENFCELVKQSLGLNKEVEEVAATDLPFNDPQPSIEFTEHNFVVSGNFASGPRKKVQAMIEGKGGLIQKTVTKVTDYLVVGELASRNWIHSAYGRKIEKAIKLRDNGCSVSIIDEQHWLTEIKNYDAPSGYIAPVARTEPKKIKITTHNRGYLKSKSSWRIKGSIEGEAIEAYFNLGADTPEFEGICAAQDFVGNIDEGIANCQTLPHLNDAIFKWVKKERNWITKKEGNK